MTIEAGVLIAMSDEVIYWHLPKDRNTVALPDSRDLWDVIWENRDRVWGFAHTHPGSGPPHPSWTDITTFSAVELALGKRLYWPILTADAYCMVTHEGPGKHDYRVTKYPISWGWSLTAKWAPELRRLSNF